MLCTPFALRGLQLVNRAVMAPLTRQRASQHNTPNSLMATYSAQRAAAGLIITERASPLPGAQGYTDYPTLAL